MEWLTTKNTGALRAHDLPLVSLSELMTNAGAAVTQGRRIIGCWGRGEQELIVTVVLADDAQARLYVARGRAVPGEHYPSQTPTIPAFHLFERELYEDFGLVPDGHSWLKPVRYGHTRFDRRLKPEEYPFYRMEGDEVHEVAVGPVHAGIIEPGHFRFVCTGETVHHLEIQLGYQHRGIEALLAGPDAARAGIHLAESITGDTVIGHAVAHAQLRESLSSCSPARRAHSLRGLALELERAANHIGDLGAICNDVAFLTGAAAFGAIRTEVINATLAVCGNRFGRGMIRPGGTVFDIDPSLADHLMSVIEYVRKRVDTTAAAMFSSAGVLARLEQTGVISHTTAREIGLVGPAARASGLNRDVRTDHPSGAYRYHPLHTMTLGSGDVYARSYIRYLETLRSLDYIAELLRDLPPDIGKPRSQLTAAPDSLALSLVEGWRGEILHAAETGHDGAIIRYKIKDPSFHNWFGLALSVRDNGISDFPLCNKSFNLSYCGFDL